MMCISVDLPEPDGPHDREHLAFADLQVDAAERVDLDLAQHVALGDIPCLKNDSVSAQTASPCLMFGCSAMFYSATITAMPSTSSSEPESATSSPS